MKTKKEELVDQLIDLRDKQKEVRKLLDEIDHEERLEESKKYFGKCFKEINKFHDKCIRCLFVYGIDNESCDTMSLLINYWQDKEDSWFGLEYHSHFNPKRWAEDAEKWDEITKEEFLEHYEKVQRRIALVKNL